MTKARKSIAQAKALPPTFSEVYRISGIVESSVGDLLKAKEKYETALDYEPRSTIAMYSHSLFLSRFFEDSESALAQVDDALRIDPASDALLTARALHLTRLGHSDEATKLYDKLLSGLKVRFKKWRITTIGQAAECYRPFAEQDLRMWRRFLVQGAPREGARNYGRCLLIR